MNNINKRHIKWSRLDVIIPIALVAFISIVMYFHFSAMAEDQEKYYGERILIRTLDCDTLKERILEHDFMLNNEQEAKHRYEWGCK